MIPTLAAVQPALITFCQARAQIIRLVLFGSLARGEARADSDVDVAATFAPGSTPRGMAHFAYLDDLEKALAAHLGRAAHLIEHRAPDGGEQWSNRALQRAVLRDGIVVYERGQPAEQP